MSRVVVVVVAAGFTFCVFCWMHGYFLPQNKVEDIQPQGKVSIDFCVVSVFV